MRDDPNRKFNAPVKITEPTYFKYQGYTSLIQASFFYRSYKTAEFLL